MDQESTSHLNSQQEAQLQFMQIQEQSILQKMNNSGVLQGGKYLFDESDHFDLQHIPQKNDQESIQQYDQSSFSSKQSYFKHQGMQDVKSSPLQIVQNQIINNKIKEISINNEENNDIQNNQNQLKQNFSEHDEFSPSKLKNSSVKFSDAALNNQSLRHIKQLNTEPTVLGKKKNVTWSFLSFIIILVYTQRFISKISTKLKGIKLIKQLPNSVTKHIDKAFYLEGCKLKEKRHSTVLQNIESSISLASFQKNILHKKSLKKLEQTDKNKVCLLQKCIQDFWFKKIPTIQPNQRLKVIFDIWLSICILYKMFIITVKLGFFLFEIQESKQLTQSYVHYVQLTSFLIDILFTFNTGIYENGIIIYDKKQIARQYVQKGSFFSDIIVSLEIIFSIYIFNSNSTIAMYAFYFSDLVIFLKIQSLVMLYGRIERVFTENERIAQLFPLFSLILKILILAHIVGIAYHMIAVFQIQYQDADNTWVHTQGLYEKTWIDKYLNSVYWSVSTMVTILLYLPQTNTEVVFAILSIFLMTGVFGYALNTIGIIINDMNKKQKEYKAQRVMVNRFFKKRKVPEKLRERITLYLDFVYQQSRGKNEEEEKSIVQNLSNQLRSEVMQHINSEYIDKFNFLIKQFSKDTKDQILEIIEEEHYSPDEYIIKEEINNNIYVIMKGTVEIYLKKDETSEKITFEKKGKGYVFGQNAFFDGSNTQYNVRSLQACMILKIQREKLIKIIKNNDQDYQKFRMISDHYSFLKTSRLIPSKCMCCNSTEHEFQTCDKNHYVQNWNQLIYDYKKLNTQLRGNFIRSGDTQNCDYIRRKFNSYKDLEDIQECVQEIFSEDNVDDELVTLALQNQQFYCSLVSKKQLLEEEREHLINHINSNQHQIAQIYSNNNVSNFSNLHFESYQDNNNYSQNKDQVLNNGKTYSTNNVIMSDEHPFGSYMQVPSNGYNKIFQKNPKKQKAAFVIPEENLKSENNSNSQSITQQPNANQSTKQIDTQIQINQKPQDILQNPQVLKRHQSFDQPSLQSIQRKQSKKNSLKQDIQKYRRISKKIEINQIHQFQQSLQNNNFPQFSLNNNQQQQQIMQNKNNNLQQKDEKKQNSNISIENHIQDNSLNTISPKIQVLNKSNLNNLHDSDNVENMSSSQIVDLDILNKNQQMYDSNKKGILQKKSYYNQNSLDKIQNSSNYQQQSPLVQKPQTLKPQQNQGYIKNQNKKLSQQPQQRQSLSTTHYQRNSASLPTNILNEFQPQQISQKQIYENKNRSNSGMKRDTFVYQPYSQNQIQQQQPSIYHSDLKNSQLVPDSDFYEQGYNYQRSNYNNNNNFLNKQSTYSRYNTHNQFTRTNTVMTTTVYNAEGLQINKEKKQHDQLQKTINDWDFKNFDKPKLYNVYMIYNNWDNVLFGKVDQKQCGDENYNEQNSSNYDSALSAATKIVKSFVFQDALKKSIISPQHPELQIKRQSTQKGSKNGSVKHPNEIVLSVNRSRVGSIIKQRKSKENSRQIISNQRISRDKETNSVLDDSLYLSFNKLNKKKSYNE